MNALLFTITEIQNENDIILVSGETLTGRIKGIWKADGLSPAVGASYQIELDFGIIDRNTVTINPDAKDASTEILNDSVSFTALCESIDEIYFLRFSFDGLEILEIENDDFTIQEGDFLTFEKPFTEIGIYPY